MIDVLNNDLIDTLQTLNDDPDFARLFNWFASRTKDSSETGVERAQSKTGIDYRRVRYMFQHLSDLGLGRYIPGRKGYPSRIGWNYSLKAIGNAARGNSVENFELDLSDLDDIEDIESNEQGETSDDIQTHRFPLRRELTVDVALPVNLTRAEAERLAAFITSLPI